MSYSLFRQSFVRKHDCLGLRSFHYWGRAHHALVVSLFNSSFAPSTECMEILEVRHVARLRRVVKHVYAWGHSTFGKAEKDRLDAWRGRQRVRLHPGMRLSAPKFRNVPVTPTPSIFPKVLPYKWEAYCSTNGRRTAEFPFLRSLEARKVWRYKWGAYCRTNWRCTAVLFRQVVGVGVSETLPRNHAIFAIAIANFHRRPEIAATSGPYALKQRSIDLKLWIWISIASDCDFFMLQILGPVLAERVLSRIFVFGPPDFFAVFQLVAGFFLHIFVGRSARKDPPRKSPTKSSKMHNNKNPLHISAEGPRRPGQKVFWRKIADT